MNKSILIVDDDQDFSQLLRGVFEQGGYTVFTAFSAEQGFQALEREHIELVVTDHRLPGGITGTEFLRQLRDRGITLPVIVVSGFLNDEAIRELIRDGVSGIFIKPLNIFSLIKKTNDILEERAKVRAASGEAAGPSGPVLLRSIGRIEGASAEGKAFLQRARAAAAFQRNLLLIGPGGTPFEDVARDLVSLSAREQRCVFLAPGSVNAGRLAALFQGEEGGQPVTLVISEAERLSADEVDALIGLGDERGGSNSPLRMIFCLSQSVEDLYDNEVIDEEFYLFLGTNELRVPPLKKMPEDLIAMARKELQEQAGEAVFDNRLRALLLSHDWPENVVELRSVIVRAISLAQPMAPKVRHFEAALHPAHAGPDEGGEIRSTFERFLLQEKRRYESALELLTSPQD